MNSRSRNKDHGFTLLEVMIVIAILAFMSLGIYQLTTETFHLRESLADEGDFYNGIRLSMGVMNRDIVLLYSPLILLPYGGDPAPGTVPGTPAGQAPPGTSPASQSPQQQNPSILYAGLPGNVMGDFQQTSNFWGPAIDKTGMRPSRFLGTETKMSFISASHARLYKDSPESEFSKITYELQKDDNQPEDSKIPDALVLTKTENTDVFDMDDTRDKDFNHSFRILPGIVKGSFAYCRYDETAKRTCGKTWDSEKTDIPHHYPDLIQVHLEIKGPTDLSFEGTYEFRPEVPLHGIDPSS